MLARKALIIGFASMAALGGCGTQFTMPAWPGTASSTQSPTVNPSASALPSSDPASDSASEEQPSPSPTATGAATASSAPSASASPSRRTLTAADLIDSLVTPGELTKAQGRTFSPEKDFPNWSQALPLSIDHDLNLRFGMNESTRPARCAAIAYFFNDGFLRRQAQSGLIVAAGFANNYNKDQYLGQKIYVWQSNPFLMKPGMAAKWQSNARAVADECKTFKAISGTGDIEPQGSARNLRWQTGSAFVVSLPNGNGGRTRHLFISEAIGDVLYLTSVSFDSSKVGPVSLLYNRKANILATLQGVSRSTADLAELKTSISIPSSFIEIPLTDDSSA